MSFWNKNKMENQGSVQESEISPERKKAMREIVEFLAEPFAREEENYGWNFEMANQVRQTLIPAKLRAKYNGPIVAHIWASFGNGVVLTYTNMILYAEDSQEVVIPFDGVDYIQRVGIPTIDDETEEMQSFLQPFVNWEKSEDTDNGMILKLTNGGTKEIEYPEVDDNDKKSLNVAALYGVIHAYLKRGSLLISDANNDIKELFYEALIDEDREVYINYTAEGVRSYISFSGNNHGFDNSGMDTDFIVGEDSLANGGYVLMFEGSSPIYVTRHELCNSYQRIDFSKIEDIYYQAGKAGSWLNKWDTNEILVDDDEGDNFELVDDTFENYDDDKLVEVIKVSIDFAKN